jgi:hypothetical protein
VQERGNFREKSGLIAIGKTNAMMTPLLSDCSQNHYAGAMKVLANGLYGGSRLLLIPFVLYQIYAHETASIFSFYTLLVIVVCEVVFVTTAALCNFFQAAVVSAPLVALFCNKRKITWAQNYGNTVGVVYGVGLCILAWFFAEHLVNFLYDTSE